MIVFNISHKDTQHTTREEAKKKKVVFFNIVVVNFATSLAQQKTAFCKFVGGRFPVFLGKMNLKSGVGRFANHYKSGVGLSRTITKAV
jgi:hypothetical protein